MKKWRCKFRVKLFRTVEPVCYSFLYSDNSDNTMKLQVPIRPLKRTQTKFHLYNRQLKALLAHNSMCLLWALRKMINSKNRVPICIQQSQPTSLEHFWGHWTNSWVLDILSGRISESWDITMHTIAEGRGETLFLPPFQQLTYGQKTDYWLSNYGNYCDVCLLFWSLVQSINWNTAFHSE